MDNILKPNWVLMGANQAPLPHLEKQFASGYYTWLHLFRSFQKEMFSDEIWKLFSEYSKIDKTTVVPTLSIYHLGAYAIQATDKTNNLNRHLTETVARYAEFYNRPIANLFNIDADFGPSPEQANPAHIRTLLGETGLIVVHRIDQTAVETASQSRWGRALDNAQYVRIGTIKHPRAVINNAAGKNYLQFLLGEADLHNQWKTEFRTEHRAEIVEQVACVEAVRDCSHVIDHLKKQILKLAATHNLTCETLKKHESYIEQKAAERTKAAQDKTGQSLLGQIIQNVQFFKEAQGQAAAKSGAREWTPEEIEAYKNKERTRLQQNFANEFNSLAPLHNHSRSDISRWIEIDLRADPTSKEVDYVFNTCGEIIEGAKSLIEQSSNQPPAEAIASLEAFSKELQKKQATLTARRNELAEKNSLKAEKYEAWKEAWITKTEKAVTIAPGYIDFYVLKNTALKLGLIAKYGYWKLANTPLDIKDFLKLELPVAPRLQKANADQSEEQAKLDYANNIQTYRVDLQARINKTLNEPTPERLIACVRTLQLEWKEPEPIEDLARFPKLDARLLQAPEVNITQKIRPTFNPAAALQIVLDRRTFLYNPVLGKNTAAKEALLDTPVIVAQGYDFVQTQLRNLDYKIEISSEIANRIERAKMRSQIAQAPNRELAGFECLAYYDYGMYVAQASVNDPEGNPVWIQGKQYLITPGWGNRTETLSEHSFNQGENADTGETGVEGSNAVTEIRHMSFQYSYWDVQTEGTPVRISETHDRAELEIENSLRKDPTIEPLSTAKGDTLEERAQNQEDENFRLRIELNPILDSNGQTIPPDETWKPCLDEFIQVFPPPSPMPVPLRYEEEIKALMAKAYKRFGSRYVNRAKAGLPLNAPESTLAEAKRLYEAEREASGILWHELPDLDPQRAHDQAQASSNISHKVYADKAGYCDRAEGRLNEIKYYQLREAAIGAFKRSSLNNSVPGSGKTLMTLMQCHMMDVKQAYVVTLTRLLKTWERECQRLKIPVFWIKGPTDALALKKKIEAHQKAGTRPSGTEIYLVSSEWLCLAGESNMQFLPWWGRHKLQEDYQKVFAFLGAWIKGMNTPESNEILKIMQDINERKHVTDQTYKDYETAKKEGIAWIRDPNRLQEQHGVNRDTFFKEKGEAVGCDRSWNIDVTELCNHSDREDDPRAQIHLYLSAGTVDILSTRPDTRAAVEKSGLRVTRSIRYEVQHTKCPSCRREAPHWKGTHCRACGHDPRFYSIKPTAETVAERPPVVSGNDLEVWASKPVQVAYTDRGRKKLVIHEGNGRSNRAYPGYKLLPLVDALIVDEFHNFVSFRTLHGKAIFDVPAREVLLTSGTLCRTRTSQAEPALALVHDANSPEFPYSRHAMGLFRERFATYETTTVINGKKTKKSKIEAPEASNANALRRLLHGRVVGVDEKTMETQWGLKKVNERVQKFAFSETEQEAYQKELNEVAEWRNALMEQIKTGDYETVKQARKLLLAGTKHQVNRLKALCNGISKVNAAVAWAKARHEAGDRFVMVCKSVKLWQDVRKALKNEGIPIETIDEKITTEERDPVLTEWAAGTKNLLTRIKLVAEGFNQMVCCNWILFLELEDAPGYNRQMQKRLNRIGQTKDVFCDFLIGEMTGQKKTIDEAALANFIRREKALEEITSRTARYRGPAALLDEFQAQQGLLHVLEDATSNTMSELATSNQVVDINDWNEPVATEKSEEDKQADILKSFEAELLQSDLPAQPVPQTQPETPVLLEVAPEPAPAPKTKVEIPTAEALSPETKKEIADVIDQEIPVNALFPILKNIRRSRIARKAGDPNQMELFSNENP